MIEPSIVHSLLAHGVKRAVAAEPMSRHTSWRIGGPADYLCVVEEEEQLAGAVDVAVKNGLPWLVLGGGNNVLVSDRGIAGLVILNRLRGITIEPASAPSDAPRQVACGAGVFFARAAQYTAKRGYTGLEWGIAIPGTVGGGVVNNAGAHAADVAGALISADVLDASGHRRTLSAANLKYQYRQSMLKTPHTVQSSAVVTSCRFRIEAADSATALARVEQLREHRLRTQPVKEASAGSTFTNPPNDYAGRLIEAAGLKGHTIGGAQISPLHANFILNIGGARASDVIELVCLARTTVAGRFGVILHPEIQFVGRWNPQELGALLENGAKSDE
jgi:UDP-N-acetylmuramate dehydrogenase